MADNNKNLPSGTLTVIETVYYRPLGEEATAVDTRFSQSLVGDEQVYERRCRASESMEALDLGWFAEKPDSIGYVRIANDEGKFLQVNPTDEQRKESSEKILILSVDGIAFDRIIPGDSRRISPPDATSISIESASGVTRFTINIYPA